MLFSNILTLTVILTLGVCSPTVKREIPSAFTDGVTTLGERFDSVNDIVELFVSTWGSNMTVHYGNEIVWALEDAKTSFDEMVTNVGSTSTFTLTSEETDQVKASLNDLAAKVQTALGPFPGIRNKVGAAGGSGLASAIYTSLSAIYTIFIPNLPNDLVTWFNSDTATTSICYNLNPVITAAAAAFRR